LGLAPAAHAADELYLRWDNCFGDGGAYNKTFACDTNSGFEFLVGSFRLAQTRDTVTALETIVDLAPLGMTLPSWWQFVETGSCRQNSLIMSLVPPLTANTCVDHWSTNGAAGGRTYQFSTFVDGVARLKMVQAVPQGFEFTVPAGEEAFAFSVRIDHAKTVGPSACSGCSVPMCIGWGQAVLHFGSLRTNQVLGASTPDHGSNVTWQTGAVANTRGFCPPNRSCDSDVLCQAVTRTRMSTWGAIQSLYR
jgi:hypothetical protein